MITVRRIILVIFCLTAIGFILYTGITRYTGYYDSITASPEAMKLAAENFLFIAIVISAVLLLLLIIILFMSRNIYRELDRISEPMKLGNYSPEVNFKRLGVLGDRINKLYRNLNQVNEGKTLKISSLNSLLTFFLNNIDLPLIIANIAGTIVYVSRQYCEKFEKEKDKVLNKSIQDVLGELRFPDIVYTFEESRAPFRSEDKKILFYPVYNKYNSISEIILIWDHGEVKTDERVEQKAKQEKAKSVRDFIRKRLRRESGKK